MSNSAYKNGFRVYLQLERGLSENTLSAYMHDVDLLIGFISEEKKIEIFNKSHIFAFPSYYGEGFPTVILEAMASGQAVVTTPVAGLSEALSDGQQGLLIQSHPPEPQEIAEKIMFYLSSPSKLTQVGQSNIKEVKMKYDARIVCNTIADYYLEISS